MPNTRRVTSTCIYPELCSLPCSHLSPLGPGNARTQDKKTHTHTDRQTDGTHAAGAHAENACDSSDTPEMPKEPEFPAVICPPHDSLFGTATGLGGRSRECMRACGHALAHAPHMPTSSSRLPHPLPQHTHISRRLPAP